MVNDLHTLTRKPREALVFRQIVVIGGGCYGSWYAQQLARAAAHGALRASEVTVLDRDDRCLVAERLHAGEYSALPLRFVQTEWAPWLAEWLAADVPDSRAADAIVPSPLMPHLLFDWLLERARERTPDREISVEPLRVAPQMPWQRAAPDGRHYVSFADWMCPVNCIEPARCPATRGERNWSMPPALAAYVDGERESGHPLDGPIIFHCLHRTWGVGMIDAEAIVAADRVVAEAAARGPARVLVGTVSHCHGALGVLRVS